MIGWLLRRWQRRWPGPALAVSLLLLVGGIVVLTLWVLHDLARGLLLRPAIALAALAALAIRTIVSFRPRRPRDPSA